MYTLSFFLHKSCAPDDLDQEWKTQDHGNWIRVFRQYSRAEDAIYPEWASGKNIKQAQLEESQLMDNIPPLANPFTGGE